MESIILQHSLDERLLLLINELSSTFILENNLLLFFHHLIYYSNGIIINGLWEGLFIIKTEFSTQLIGRYEKGLPVLSIALSKDKISDYVYFLDGKKHGPHNYYYIESQTLSFVINYQHGLKQGKTVIYNRQGKVKEMIEYDQGKKINTINYETHI